MSDDYYYSGQYAEEQAEAEAQAKEFAFRNYGLKQEDYNSMMRLPGEVRRVEVQIQMNSCPNCGERYCGDGVDYCTECETPN